MATRISGASMASTASRWPTAGTAASAASGASPTACAIRSSRPTKAASSPRRSSTNPTPGRLVLYARYLDDKNQFITPIPVIQRGTDNFSEYPGLRSAHGDLLQRGHPARAARRLSGRRHRTRISPNGRGAQMLFRRRQLRPRLRQRLVDHQQVSRQRRRRRHQRVVLGQQSRHAERRAVQHSHQSRRFRSCRRDRRRPPSSAAARCAPDQSVIHQGWWFIHKELQSVNNDFRLSKELFEGNTLTRRPVPRLLRDGRRMGAGQPDVHDQRAQCPADHRELRECHGPDRRSSPTSRAFSTTAASTSRSTATRSTARSIYPTPGASTSGCWTPRCATRTRTPPTASAT